MSCHRRQSTPLGIGGTVTGVPDMVGPASITGVAADTGDMHKTNRSLIALHDHAVSA